MAVSTIGDFSEFGSEFNFEFGTRMTIGTPTVFASGNASVGLFTTTAAIVSGNLAVVAIVLAAGAGSKSVTSVSDGTNKYTQAKEILMTGSNATADLWYCPNCQAVASGATLTISVTGIPALAIVAAQVSGVSGPEIASIGSAENSGGSTTPSASTAGLQTTNEIVFGMVAAVTQLTVTESANFTNLGGAQSTSLNGGATVNMGYAIVSNTLAQTYAPTLSGSQVWADIALPFQGSGTPQGGNINSTFRPGQRGWNW